MTKPLEHEATRDCFLEAAQKEMMAFERKERDFRRRTKQEEADRLRLAIKLTEH